MFKVSDFRAEILKNGIQKSNTYEVLISPNKNLTSKFGIGRLSLRCSNVQFPGVSFNTVDTAPRFGYGPIESNPYGVNFDDILMTFIMDNNGDVYKYFYDWMNAIVNFESAGQSVLQKAFEVGFKDNYVADLIVNLLDSNLKTVLSATVFRAFPKHLPPFDLAADATNDFVKLTIPFSYTDYIITRG